MTTDPSLDGAAQQDAFICDAATSVLNLSVNEGDDEPKTAPLDAKTSWGRARSTAGAVRSGVAREYRRDYPEPVCPVRFHDRHRPSGRATGGWRPGQVRVAGVVESVGGFRGSPQAVEFSGEFRPDWLQPVQRRRLSPRLACSSSSRDWAVASRFEGSIFPRKSLRRGPLRQARAGTESCERQPRPELAVQRQRLWNSVQRGRVGFQWRNVRVRGPVNIGLKNLVFQPGRDRGRFGLASPTQAPLGRMLIFGVQATRGGFAIPSSMTAGSATWASSGRTWRSAAVWPRRPILFLFSQSRNNLGPITL